MSQQRIVNKFLTTHFGKRIVESEKAIGSLNNEYVEYQKHEFQHIDGKMITIWHRSIADLIRFYLKRIDASILENIQHIEVCLGGDHGKNTFIYMAILLFRYTTEKETYRLEIKLGEINEEKDKIEFIEQLMSKISSSLGELNINPRGDFYMSISNLDSITFSSEKLNSDYILMKFFLIGDLKSLFQTLGRAGYDSSYCLFCKCRPKEWKSGYESSKNYIGAEKWTISRINEVALDQFQKQSSGTPYGSVGIRGYTLLSCIPLTRVLPPILHLLLGLGNDVYSKFKDFLQIRIEKISGKESEARDMTLLAEIQHDAALIQFDDLKKEVNNFIQHRIAVNADLKDRNLPTELKQQLLQQKVQLLAIIKDKTTQRNEAEKNVKATSKNLSKCREVEKSAKKEDKDPSRYAVANYIESVILKQHRISKSCYHAGDLEGNDIRRLMGNGLTIFEQIKDYLVLHKPHNVGMNEIREICTGFGRLLSLLDSVFSTLHAKRNSVTASRLETLKSDLNLVRIKWNEMNLSYTPKFHLLYEHVPGILFELNGFFDMGEDCIERWHQIRMRHYARIRCLRSENLQKINQAKYEFTTTNDEINNIIKKVNEGTKRKRNNADTLARQNHSTKRKVRQTKRDEVKVEVLNEDRKILPTHHDRLKEEYKSNHNL